MTSAWLLLLSGILIGAGVSLIARDLGRSRHGLARPAPDAGAKPAMDAAQAGAGGATQADGASAPAGGEPERLHPGLAQQWALLTPLVEAAVAGVNQLLAPERLALGTPQAADWSYRQRAYGTHRRLLLAEDSIAWLRLELTAEGRLQGSLKAHDETRAAINASADRTAADVTSQQVSELLLACLRPAGGIAASSPVATPEGPSWHHAYATILSALKATNAALALAGARIVPQLDDAAPPVGAASLLLRLEVGGDDLAGVQIAMIDDAVEVAVDPSARPKLARQRRVALAGMTIHALAEAIAGCAWPAIAHHASARPGLGC
jgi:hypothetical protein